MPTRGVGAALGGASVPGDGGMVEVVERLSWLAMAGLSHSPPIMLIMPKMGTMSAMVAPDDHLDSVDW
jgi:hypothetical protein